MYLDVIWPILSEAFGNKKKKRGYGFHSEQLLTSVLVRLAGELLINWCREYPRESSNSSWQIMPLFREDDQGCRWEPVVQILIDEFGNHLTCYALYHRIMDFFLRWHSEVYLGRAIKALETVKDTSLTCRS